VTTDSGRGVSAAGDSPQGSTPRPDRTWTIRITAPGRWLTSNNGAYRWGARSWRHATMVSCQGAHLPKGITPVTIHAVCWYVGRSAPVRDNKNLDPTLKAIVDGLTPTVVFRGARPHTRGGYGLIPDDSDRHVRATTWELRKAQAGQPWVDLTITEVPDA
jgi:hypothetical protein